MAWSRRVLLVGATTAVLVATVAMVAGPAVADGPPAGWKAAGGAGEPPGLPVEPDGARGLEDPPDRGLDAQPVASAADAAAASLAKPSWCTRLKGGAPSTAPGPLALSAAHSEVRGFGIDSAFGTSDAALADALAPAGSLDTAGLDAAVERYANQLTDVCTLAARPSSLGPASVRMIGTTALVTPGTGAVTVPPQARRGVIDLRGLPEVAGLDAALRAAVAPFLKRAVTGTTAIVRSHDGPVDEALSRFNVYTTGLGVAPPAAVAPAGAADLPLALLTEQRMPAAAHQLAGMLRVARRAWVFGADVSSAAAEADWQPVAAAGIGVRTRALAQPTVIDAGPHALHQDDPDDPTTASTKLSFTLGGDAPLLTVDSGEAPGTDADLYLLRDANGDQAFTPDEVVGYSFGFTSVEHIQLAGVVPAGDYQLWVHGYFVPKPATISVAIRSATLWPDLITRDGSVPADAASLDTVPLAGQPPAVTGPATRTSPTAKDPWQDTYYPPTVERGELRADLVIVHGITRRFFPYFDIVGDGIDDRLLETLVEAEAWDGTDRLSEGDLLRRFGEVLHDGHQFLFDYQGASPFVGRLPLFLDEVDGRPVVRRSLVDDVHPGDAIVSIDGRPIEDLYADELRCTSTATPGYQFDVATRRVAQMRGPEDLVLEDPDGGQRTVTVDPVSTSVYFDQIGTAPSTRPSGPLTDLGHPELHYLNMAEEVTPTTADANAAIAGAGGAAGLVVDMRGYPAGNHYEVAARLIQQLFFSPRFGVRQFTGPDITSVAVTQYPLAPLSPPSFSGPIVLITGPHAVSAAENFMLLLEGAGRPSAIVGQQSAGTNGNITGVYLPGGFGFTYTGVNVRRADGSQFHGIGLLPDIPVPLTAADLRDGVDRDLLVAIDTLSP